MHVQIPDADVRIIAHQTGHHLALGILRNGGIAFELHRSLTFTGDEVCLIAWSVGLQRAIEGDAVGDTVVVHRLGVEQGCCKTDVLCLGIELQVRLQFR